MQIYPDAGRISDYLTCISNFLGPRLRKEKLLGQKLWTWKCNSQPLNHLKPIFQPDPENVQAKGNP